MDQFIINEPKYNDTIQFPVKFHIPKYIKSLDSFYRRQYTKYNIPIPKKKQYSNARS